MTPLAMHLVVVLLILVCATANHDSAAAPPPCGLQELPLNLNFEFDGSPTTRYTALVRGRAGNAIIQMAHVRLFAGEHGGSAEPWAQFVRMSVDGRGPLVYAPRIGKMAFCTVDDRIEDMKALKQRCPFRNQKVKYVPAKYVEGSVRQRPEVPSELQLLSGAARRPQVLFSNCRRDGSSGDQQWEKVMAPLQAFKPKRPNWLGRNDAVIHLRISHPDDQVIQLCKDALKRQHLCSLRLDLIPIELFKNETCQKFATTPPFEFYEKLLQERGRRQAQALAYLTTPESPAVGTTNCRIVGENKVLSSNLVRRLVSELHFKKYPGGRG